MVINFQSLWLIFNEMPNPAFFHDENFRLVNANKAYCEISGVNQAELIGKPYYEFFPKRNGPLPNCKSTTLDFDACESNDEFIYKNKIYTSYSLLHRDTINLVTYAFHVFTDITSQKQSEDKFKKIASQFGVLFMLSPDSIMLLDSKGFFECNPATLKMFCCSQFDDFIGKHPFDFSPEFQPDGNRSDQLAKTHIDKAFQKGSHIFEWTHRRLDGNTFPAEVLLVSFSHNTETVLQATVRDISNRKNIEAKLTLVSEDLNNALTSIIGTMSKTMELRDAYTSGHQLRVAKISVAIAKKLGWNASKIRGLEIAALLHDIGKIAIPAEILTKPCELSQFELGLIQEHALHGYQILKNIKFPWPIAQTVYQHHERLDGSGYPLKLTGDQILFEARILGVADTIEAMSTNRPYRFSLGLESALNQLKKYRNIKYDSEVVDVALLLFGGKISIDKVLDSES